MSDKLLLRKRDPRSELPTDSVGKIAKDVTREIVLKISRVEMIGQIENLQSEIRAVLLERTRKTNSLQRLHIERNKCRKAAGTISRTDKVAIFIDEREREACSHVENGRQRDAIPCVHLTTKEKTVWRIKR